jgi:hypothetical protein
LSSAHIIIYGGVSVSVDHFVAKVCSRVVHGVHACSRIAAREHEHQDIIYFSLLLNLTGFSHELKHLFSVIHSTNRLSDFLTNISALQTFHWFKNASNFTLDYKTKKLR